MKKFTSQIMALVLAFCMVAALVPTAPASAADVDSALSDVVLYFDAEHFGSVSSADTIITKIADYGTWNWKYNGDLTSETYKTAIESQSAPTNDNSGSFKYRKGYTKYYINFNATYGDLGLNFKADKAGWYILNAEKSDINGIGSTESGKTNVYVGQANSGVELAALIDSKTNASGVKSNITANAVYLEEGENIIIFRGIENSDNDPRWVNNHTQMGKLTFSPASADEIPEQEESDGNIELDFCVAAAANTSLAGLSTITNGWTWNQAETGSYIVNQIVNAQSLKNWWSNGPTGQRISFYNSQITSQSMAFDFAVEEDGWYEITEQDIQAYTVNVTNATGEIHIISNGVDSRAASFSAAVSDTIDQSADLGSFTAEKVYLTAGTNTMVFRGTAIRNSSHTMLFVKKVVLSKTEAPTEVAQENVVLDFTTDTFNYVVGDAAGIDHVTDYVAWNWKYNAELTTAGQESTIPWASGNASGTSGDDKGYNKLRKAMKCFYIKLNSELGGIALDFYVNAAGWYKINADGIAASGVGASDSGVTNVYAGTADKMGLAAAIDANSTASGEAAIVTPNNAVYLEKGINTLILRGASNGTYGNMLSLKKITFVPASADEAPDEITEPYEQTIETNSATVLTQNATDAIFGLDGWEVNKELTPEIMYGFLKDPDSTTIPKFFKTCGAGNSGLGVSVGHMSTYFGWGDTEYIKNNTFSIDFYNDVAGEYDIGAVTVEYPDSTVVGDIAINGVVVGQITCDATENAYTAIEKTLAEKVTLNKGRNTITFTKTSGGNGFNLSKLVLTPYEEEPEILLGDANGDGKLNTRDVVALRKYISTQDATGVNVPALDTTGDGKINARDVGALRTIIANAQ